MKSLNSTKTYLLLATLILSGCGAQKEVSDETFQSSRLATPDAAGGKTVAMCNQAWDQSQTLKVNLAALQDYKGTVDPNYIHAKVTAVPASFSSDANYFAMWKWYAESTGYAYVDPQPLAFKIVKIETNEDLTGYLTTISWGGLNGIATSLGVSTPADLFRKVRFVVQLNDPQAQFDAITVSLHDKSSGASHQRVDALIPMFYADPRVYAQDHAPVLNQIHPFHGVDYSQWTANVFASKVNEFCYPMTQY